MERASQLDNDWKVVRAEGRRVPYSKSKAMWEEAIVMSVEVGFPLEGTPPGRKIEIKEKEVGVSEGFCD